MSSGASVGSPERPLRVAIVGSGPAGFYAAAALLKQTGVAVRVDVFDRLPTPYGLVRGGVAPDHPKIKTVARVFEKWAATPGFRFFGNVELGRDITAGDLVEHYHQVVYAVGNETDRRMGIPGESLEGCTSATVFVGWYNAHPDHRDASFDWSSRRVGVVGNGNVAIDVARILAREADDLRPTDIADHAIEALQHSRLEEIVMLGRRGPVQAAFTPAELKELTELPRACLCVDPAELELDPASRQVLEGSSENSNARRNYAVLREVARAGAGPGRRIRLRFLVSPVEVLGDERGRVRGVRLEKNTLVGAPDGGLLARGTGVFEQLDLDWLFVSVGYEGRPLAGVPFDARRGVIPNRAGRVLDPASDRILPNQYVVGWAQSGPRGLIGEHKGASAEVVRLMLEDVAAGRVDNDRKLSDESTVALLTQRSVRYVTFDDWRRIDAAEVARGQPHGAPRRKFSDVDEMLRLLDGR